MRKPDCLRSRGSGVRITPGVPTPRNWTGQPANPRERGQAVLCCPACQPGRFTRTRPAKSEPVHVDLAGVLPQPLNISVRFPSRQPMTSSTTSGRHRSVSATMISFRRYSYGSSISSSLMATTHIWIPRMTRGCGGPLMDAFAIYSASLSRVFSSFQKLCQPCPFLRRVHVNQLHFAQAGAHHLFVGHLVHPNLIE